METIYVSFKKSQRGLQYIGQVDFQELISRNSTDLFLYEEDGNGNPCTPYLADCGGNVVYNGDMEAKTGILDFDGEYDTQYTTTFDDMNNDEISALFKSKGFKGLDVEAKINGKTAEDFYI